VFGSSRFVLAAPARRCLHVEYTANTCRILGAWRCLVLHGFDGVLGHYMAGRFELGRRTLPLHTLVRVWFRAFVWVA
jgi:hypothetical protein